MKKQKSKSRKNHIDEKVKESSEVTSYLVRTWFDVMDATGLSLSKGGKGWYVMHRSNNHDIVKAGNFKACVDFMLETHFSKLKKSTSKKSTK